MFSQKRVEKGHEIGSMSRMDDRACEIYRQLLTHSMPSRLRRDASPARV